MLWHRQAIFKSKGDKLSSSVECRNWTQGLRHQIASRLSDRWKTDWAIDDQAKKTWTRQPVLMISEHSAHSTPMPVGFRTWLWRYTCLLLILMLWHRQAIFKSKGDRLSSCAECRIWTQGLRHQIASRLNARWQTDWAIEDQTKNLKSTARPYDQRAVSPIYITYKGAIPILLNIVTHCFSHPAKEIKTTINFDSYIFDKEKTKEKGKPFSTIPNLQTNCCLKHCLWRRCYSAQVETYYILFVSDSLSKQYLSFRAANLPAVPSSHDSFICLSTYTTAKIWCC